MIGEASQPTFGGRKFYERIVDARVVIGLGFASHGAQKLFGCWDVVASAAGVFFESIGFRPGGRFALAAGLGEFLGGLALD